MIAWYWGLINALLVSLVIYMNGREWRSGWAAGVLAQAWIIAFGLVNGAWTFAFSTIPLVMFVYNWVRHPKRHPKTPPPPSDLPHGLIRVGRPITDEEFAELKRQFRERLAQADKLIDQGVHILPVPPKTVTFERPKDDTP